MVIRKPYAFLIKHFRMLHLILFGCLAYVFASLNILRQFFTQLYNQSVLTYGDAMANFDSSLYYIPLVTIAMSAIIFLLLRKKNKPYTLYLIIAIYSIVLFFANSYFGMALSNISKTTQTMDAVGLYRDIVILVMAPDVVLLLFCFIRGIGFDVKRFNFSKDIKELEIVDQDSAEYEVMIGQDSYVYKRKIRRFFREMKYYFLENKIPIIVVTVGLIVFGFVFGFDYYNKNFKKVEKTYAEQINGIYYQVNDAYVTKFDYRGKEVSDEKKYVVVNMLVKNNNDKPQSLDLNGIILGLGQLSYNPVTSKNTYFIDLGIPYENGSAIPGHATIDGLTLTFELPERVNTKQVNNFVLKVRASITEKNTDVFGVYKYFNVEARSIDTDRDEEVVCLNQQFTYDDGAVGKNKSSIIISGYDYSDTLSYLFMLCKSGSNGGCDIVEQPVTVHEGQDKTTKMLLELDYSMDTTTDSYFMKNLKTVTAFYKKFVYLKSSKKRTIDYVDVKKEEYDKIYLIVDELDDREKVYFSFRAKTYVLYLDPDSEYCKST